MYTPRLNGSFLSCKKALWLEFGLLAFHVSVKAAAHSLSSDGEYLQHREDSIIPFES
jgi:hypothetical protein